LLSVIQTSGVLLKFLILPTYTPENHKITRLQR
jgi:hypothetical protein